MKESIIKPPLHDDYCVKMKLFQGTKGYPFIINGRKSRNVERPLFENAVVFEMKNNEILLVQIVDYRNAVVTEYDHLVSCWGVPAKNNRYNNNVVFPIREIAFGKKDETTDAIMNSEIVCDLETQKHFLRIYLSDVLPDDNQEGLLTIGAMEISFQISTKKGNRIICWLFGEGLSGKLDKNTNTVHKTAEKAFFVLLTKNFPLNATITYDNGGNHICAELGYDCVYKKTQMKTIDPQKEVSAAIKKAVAETTPVPPVAVVSEEVKKTELEKKEKTVKKKPAPQKV